MCCTIYEGNICIVNCNVNMLVKQTSGVDGITNKLVVLQDIGSLVKQVMDTVSLFHIHKSPFFMNVDNTSHRLQHGAFLKQSTLPMFQKWSLDILGVITTASPF